MSSSRKQKTCWSQYFYGTRTKKTLLTIAPKPKLKKLQIIEIKPKKNTNNKVKLIAIKSNKELTSKIRPKTKWVIINEIDKHRENIKKIISCSNATPIGRYGGIGFICAFCVLQFPTPAKLKTHTIMEHKECHSTFMHKVQMSSYIVKLDITDLECTLCQTKIDSLDSLINHLTSFHELNYFNDIKSHIVPFKFDDDEMKCVICEKAHNNFKVLLEHMNSHFRNYICDTCNAGFVNKRILQTHALRHKTGNYSCSLCSKEFNTAIKVRDHERAVHVTHSMRSKCGYCGEKFSDYAKKNNHEVKFHGAKPVVLKCQACDKTFDNQRSLTVHTKSFHLMQYRNAK